MGLFNKFWAKPAHSYHQYPFRSLESFNHDGIEVARRRRRRYQFPLRQVMLFVLAIVSFKIFLFFEMGGAAYGAKIDELKKGDTIEQWAAVAMTLDPVSQVLVDTIRFGKL